MSSCESHYTHSYQVDLFESESGSPQASASSSLSVCQCSFVMQQSFNFMAARPVLSSVLWGFWGDVRWNAAQFVSKAWGFSGSPAQHSNMLQALSYRGWTSAKDILLHSALCSWTLSMALNVPGLVATIIFYLLVLGIGIGASIKSKRDENRAQANHADMALLGNRKISLVVGIFTTTGQFSLSCFVQHCSRCNLLVPSFLQDI